MALEIGPGATTELVRGVAPIVLGALLFALGGGRRAPLLLGSFLVVDGASTLTGWLTWGFSDPVDTHTFAAISFDLRLLPEALLLGFLVAFPSPPRWTKRPNLLLLAILAPALLHFALNLAAPQLFRTPDPRGFQETLLARWLLVGADVYLIAAIAVALARMRSLAPGHARTDFALVLLGVFGFWFIYGPAQIHGPIIARLWGDDIATNFLWIGPTTPMTFVLYVGLVLKLALLFALLVYAGFRLRREPEGHRGADKLFLGGYLVLVGVGVVQAILRQSFATPVIFWSMYVPIGATLAAFGLARTELASPRLRSAVAATGIVITLSVVYIGGAVAFTDAFGATTTGTTAAQLSAVALTAGVGIPLFRLARGLGAGLIPGEGSSGDHSRRISVYRAALEDVLDDAPSTQSPTSSRLTRLRGELGLSERDHAVMLQVVRDQRERNAAPVLAPGMLFLARYRVQAALGAGTYGETWLARDERLGRAVAIKALHGATGDDAMRRRFAREMRALATVRHPNVIRLHDVEEMGSRVFLIMEHASGGNLRNALAAQGAFDTARVIRAADELLGALDAIHAAGLLHRDVKPSNILLEGDHALLADFGAVGRARPDAGATAIGLDTASPGAVGTLRYAAPEILVGHVADARSDLYSLAASIAELATGAPYLPFASLSEPETRRLILTRAPDLSGIHHGALRAWLERCLDKDPDMRFPDAAEAKRALAAPPAT